MGCTPYTIITLQIFCPSFTERRLIVVRKYKRLPIEVKQKILESVKQGQKVKDLAHQYGISPSLIYTWLKQDAQTSAGVSWFKYNKLKKENEELKRIIGLMALKLERGEKN